MNNNVNIFSFQTEVWREYNKLVQQSSLGILLELQLSNQHKVLLYNA